VRRATVRRAWQVARVAAAYVAPSGLLVHVVAAPYLYTVVATCPEALWCAPTPAVMLPAALMATVGVLLVVVWQVPLPPTPTPLLHMLGCRGVPCRGVPCRGVPCRGVPCRLAHTTGVQVQSAWQATGAWQAWQATGAWQAWQATGAWQASHLGANSLWATPYDLHTPAARQARRQQHGSSTPAAA
jgi:hypothetical protein